jgi:hypothetical protein
VANEFDRTDGHPVPHEQATELQQLVIYADSQERKVSQLQAALDSRVVIERAIGLLAERFDLAFTEAFELLRGAARNTRQQVRGIAEELGTSRRTPPEIARLLPRTLGALLSSQLDEADFLHCPRCGAIVPD